jgi:hypothetical protein
MEPSEASPVNKCPHAVTAIGLLFLMTGLLGLVYHASDFRTQSPFQYDLVWVCLVRLLAVIGGVFLLRAHNWARWLLVIWMAYHVFLSALHSWSQVIVHALLLGVFVFFLFRPSASLYFRGPLRTCTEVKPN